MNDIDLQYIAEDLTELKGSELKAIIAIYTEGRYLGSRDMMNLTGMSRKTCLLVMESEHVKEAIDRVQNNKDGSVDKELLNNLRRELINLEQSHGPDAEES